MAEESRHRSRMPVAFVGHVDHGKSTVIGRLMADTGRLPEGKIEAVKALCEQTGKPFEYAFLLDALKDERAQGITIDSARCFFEGEQRDYLILDAPGHIEFLKNMITGAAHAEAAVLVIDAAEGVRENSRRHGTLLGLLGVGSLVVVVNKLDLVDYRASVFESIVQEYSAFLQKIGLTATAFVPVSAVRGDNVVQRSAHTPWYEGPSVLEALEALPRAPSGVEGYLRMPVQGVYKFTDQGDRRRIVAGRVVSGHVRVGDPVLFLPSGKRSSVASIEQFAGSPPDRAAAGCSTGFTLTEQVYVRRGELACHPDHRAPVAGRIRTSVFWMARAPLEVGAEYKMKLGTAEAPVVVDSIEKTLDASDLSSGGKADRLPRHGVGECILHCQRGVALDPAAICAETGRFVLVSDYEIAGGGIVREVLDEEIDTYRREAAQREARWIPGGVQSDERARRSGQRSALIVITGPVGSGRKNLARALERQLFDSGRNVYYLAIGSVVHGLDLDLGGGVEDAEEHLRRFGEVVHVLLDAGLLVIATARNLGRREIERLKVLVGSTPVVSVGIGETSSEESGATVSFDAAPPVELASTKVVVALEQAGVFAIDRS